MERLIAGIKDWPTSLGGVAAAIAAWLGLRALGVSGIDQLAEEAEAIGRLGNALGNTAPAVLAVVGLLWKRG